MIIHRLPFCVLLSNWFVYVPDQPLADMLLDLSDILQVSVVHSPFSIFIVIRTLCAAHTRPLKCLFNGRHTDGTVEKLRPLRTMRLLIFLPERFEPQSTKKKNSVCVSNLLMSQSVACARLFLAYF